MTFIQRRLQLDLKNKKSILLLGPRKTGKSTYLKQHFPHAHYIDLLQTDVRSHLTRHPEHLRQLILQHQYPLVMIDEIQKIPTLLDEIHWCIENTTTQFILCGSSARKLKQITSGILGGRAERYEFFPFVTSEIPHPLHLLKIFNHGLIPQHYLTQKPERILRSYLVDYLEEEIRQEAIVKNLPAFARFLEVAALMNGELLNFKNISSEAGVSAHTIKSYYEILVDTLLGFFLDPWEKSQTRRMIQTRKFYLFDCGVLRSLQEFREIALKTRDAGKFFETFLLHEIRAYLSYTGKYSSLFFWRTSTGLEVDLIIGRTPKIALEFKCTESVQKKDLAGLRAFAEEHPTPLKIIVYCGSHELKTEDDIQILPWTTFCRELWRGKFI